MKHIGLLGGSFDPPHKGHLYISLEAKKTLKLDEIWWLVTPQNPLKINKPASFSERVKNCKIMTKNKPIKIKEIEKKINSQFSYQTIKYLNNHYKNINFFWLMGADNLINFHKWYKWRDICDKCKILVFDRSGYKLKSLKSVAYQKMGDKTFDFITFKKVNISSSKLRKF